MTIQINYRGIILSVWPIDDSGFVGWKTAFETWKSYLWAFFYGIKLLLNLAGHAILYDFNWQKKKTNKPVNYVRPDKYSHRQEFPLYSFAASRNHLATISESSKIKIANTKIWYPTSVCTLPVHQRIANIAKVANLTKENATREQRRKEAFNRPQISQL